MDKLKNPRINLTFAKSLPTDVPIRKSYLERISITGFGNLYQEDSRFGRYFWSTILIACMVLTARDIYSLLDNAARSPDIRYQYQMNESSMMRISNVTVCSPVLMNPEKFAQLFPIPPDTQERLRRRNLTDREVIVEMASYVTPSFMYKSISKKLYRIFRDIYTNSDNVRVTDDTAELLLQTFPQCPEILRSCVFNQQPFNCCQKAVFQLGDATVCYKLTLDSNEDEEFYQTQPGFDAGLTIDAEIDVEQTGVIDEIASEGFYVYVDNAAGYFASPLVVWTEAHLFIRLEARQRRLSENCFEKPRKLKYYDFYDQGATYCKIEGLIDMLSVFAGCQAPFYLFLPNSTTACGLMTTELMRYYLMFGATWKNPNISTEAIFEQYGAELKGFERMMDGEHNYVRSLFYDSVDCKPLCQQREFNTYISYAVIDDQFNQGSMKRSKITVYYANFEYQIIDELPSTNSYTLFAQVGNILGIYGGLSVISLAQLLFYGVESFSRGKCIRRLYYKCNKNRIMVLD